MIAQNQTLFSRILLSAKRHQHICNLVRIRPSKSQRLAAGARALCSPYEQIGQETHETHDAKTSCQTTGFSVLFATGVPWNPLKPVSWKLCWIGKVRGTCAVLPSCCGIRPAGCLHQRQILLDVSTFPAYWFVVEKCLQVCCLFWWIRWVNLHWGVCGDFFLCGASTRSWSSASLKDIWSVFPSWTCDFCWDPVASDFQTSMDSLWLVALYASLCCELLGERSHRLPDLNAARSWLIWGTILHAARQEAKDLKAKQTKEPIKVYTLCSYRYKQLHV